VEVEIEEEGRGLTVRRQKTFQERLTSVYGTLNLGVDTDAYIEEMRGR